MQPKQIEGGESSHSSSWVLHADLENELKAQSMYM